MADSRQSKTDRPQSSSKGSFLNGSVPGAPNRVS
ncbi:MAG: hypothetical protein ACXVYA_10100, partial [Mycobacterium sp.]